MTSPVRAFFFGLFGFSCICIFFLAKEIWGLIAPVRAWFILFYLLLFLSSSSLSLLLLLFCVCVSIVFLSKQV